MCVCVQEPWIEPGRQNIYSFIKQILSIYCVQYASGKGYSKNKTVSFLLSRGLYLVRVGDGSREKTREKKKQDNLNSNNEKYTK